MPSPNYLLTIPYVYEPYLEECLLSLDLPTGNILAIDNTVDNKGVAESWNLGIDEMKNQNLDWLIIASAAIRFDGGGLDLLSQIEDNPLADIIHFATANYEGPNQFVRGQSPGYADGLLGWHLTAIPRRTIEAVGYFDPNFYPMCFEDIDYDLRVNKNFNWLPNWKILPVAAHGESLAHSVELAGIKGRPTELISYFATKWGRHPNARELGSYDRPFNDNNNSLAFFPPHRGRTWDGR